jgi:Zn-dependent protease with chaperone function
MTAALRAFVSIIMLIGFYVVALVLFALGLAASIWVGNHGSGAAAAKFGFLVFGATVWAVGYGTWKAVRAQDGEPHGISLSRSNAPHLWATVDELARVVGTRTPDEIYLVPEVNAAVSEKSRLMGLIGGRRTMYIGMPLMITFTVAQLRSVLAHELGHYSGAHTRFAGISYRGRLAMGRTIAHLGAGNLVGYVYRGYGRLYLLVDNAVSRRQELEADRSSVRVAGRAAAASALREVRVLDAAYDFYMARYVGPGLQAGAAPDDLFAGFHQLFQARAQELADLRAAQPDERPSRWDSHPPISVRVAAIQAAPESPVPADERPAHILLPGIQQAGLALQQRILHGANLTVLPWQQFVNTGASNSLQENMDDVLRVLALVVGGPVPDAGAVLDQIGAGRLPAMAAAIFPHAAPDEAVKQFAGVLDAFLSLAAIRSGVAEWRLSWTGPATLVDVSGAELDLEPIARLAVDPATLDEARRQLAARGVDVTTAKHVEDKVPVRRASVLAGVINMSVASQRTDVLVLDTGLVLVPTESRLAHKVRGRVVDWINAGDAEAVVAAPGARYLPIEDIESGRRARRMPVKFEITMRGGETITLDWRVDSEEQGEGYQGIMKVLEVAAAR